MPRLAWTRDETLVAFNIYCRTPFGKLHARNPEIVEVASALGRTPSALAMKCCNLAAFDEALQERGIKGLSKASRLDAEIWEQFTAQPTGQPYLKPFQLAFSVRRDRRRNTASRRSPTSRSYSDLRSPYRTRRSREACC